MGRFTDLVTVFVCSAVSMALAKEQPGKGLQIDASWSSMRTSAFHNKAAKPDCQDTTTLRTFTYKLSWAAPARIKLLV